MPQPALVGPFAAVGAPLTQVDQSESFHATPHVSEAAPPGRGSAGRKRPVSFLNGGDGGEAALGAGNRGRGSSGQRQRIQG